MEEENIDLDIKPIVRISVRNLVEFILRSGDLDNRRTSRAEREAMQKGSRLHRKLQGRMGAGYEAEVSLKARIEREKVILLIEGRADGILTEEEKITVDEIKGVYRELQFINEPVETHLAQAKCYAYMYACDNSLEQISVRMTYCNLESEQIKYFLYHYERLELGKWFDELIGEYEKWAVFEAEWKQLRNRSVESLHFPFPYRKGQKELVAGVYRTIQQKKKLFIQASTGVGKTMSSVYPAVQAVGAGMADKIFYLTAKTITRTVAQEAFQLLVEQKLQFKVLLMTAKEKLCVCSEVNCNPESCSRAKGHFDRVNAAVYEMICSENILTRERISFYAEQHCVCPYEMSLDAALWADAVICDYNYVFDYNVYLRRFFGDIVKGDYIFLIDEAHNLVDRAREMYSALLYKEEFLELKQKIKYYSRKLERQLESCNKILLGWKRECTSYEVREPSDINTFLSRLMSLMTELEKFMEDNGEEDPDITQLVLEFYFKVRHFMNMADCLDENYLIYTEFVDQRFLIRLFCVNPAVNLNHFLEKGIATVFFSATLLPIHYYNRLLSGNLDDYAMYAESVFSSERSSILLATDVSSKYNRRTQKEYEKIADYIDITISRKKGNYIAYFPSYTFMESVYQCLLAKRRPVKYLLQETVMSEEEKEDFLNAFEEEPKETLLAFCVLGGAFSEGIDLKNDRLIGTIIIGTGIPQICTERELLRRYFNREHEDGFNFAYRYPGLNKVLQAAGRVIRTEQDEGVILLLDERFLDGAYRSLFPREWKKITTCDYQTVKSAIEEFWEGRSVSIN